MLLDSNAIGRGSTTRFLLERADYMQYDTTSSTHTFANVLYATWEDPPMHRTGVTSNNNNNNNNNKYNWPLLDALR